MQFPNSIHAEGWNPKLDLGASSQSMKPLHAQGNGSMPRHHMPLVLLGVTLSLVAGAAALSTIFSPKAAETTWQAMDGLAAPGAGSNQVAQTLPSPPVASEALAVESAQPQIAPALEQAASAAEPVKPAEPVKSAKSANPETRDLTQPPELKPKRVFLPAAEPAPTPLLPPVIDPPVQDTLLAPVPVAPPVVTPAATPASSPASAPPAPLPASAPPSSPASDPPKSEPKPLPPVEPPAKLDTPDAPKAPPVQG